MPNKQIFVVNRSEITAGTRGASMGPDAILTAARTKGSDFFSGKEMIRLEDFNFLLDTKEDNPYAKRIDGLIRVFENVSECVCQVLHSDDFPFVLAGDHGSAGGTIAGIKKAFPTKRLGVVWVDAHGDLHTPYTTPSGNMHGMPLATVLKEDNIESAIHQPDAETIRKWEILKSMGCTDEKLKPEDLVFVAVRDTEEQEDSLIDRLHIKKYSVEDVVDYGSAEVASKILQRLDACDIIYVSFDVDSMDPKATSHGTGTPVKNGLMPKQAKELLLALAASPKLVCLEVVEVNPALDEKKNRMAEVTFDIVEEIYTTIEKRLK